eukprot:TRINITY_DN6009_c0_g1_i1.p1 TRINITY_DN6009_c0_g1~~TRINITY_DN6009_c0_g1_i1.p1  ORF type:complete len:390 (-),score=45.48 TRINITY_DN6009_c0_g1_i1:597-1682(-)
MKNFLSFGGTPQVFVQLLSGNYRGYAQMVNLLAEWLKIAGFQEDSISNLIKEHIKGLSLQKFDPRKADTIFEEDDLSSAPEWLEYMIQEPDWRTLIYKLSEDHKNCLLLNFAIQQISEAGHQTEIASLETASTYFSVFNKVMKDSITNILHCDEMSLSAFLPDFKKMCNHSPHTYLYTQSVLHNLQAEPNCSNIKRLSQELEASLKEKNSAGRRMRFLLTDVFHYPDIASSLTCILSTGTTNLADIIKLYNQYSRPDPPPAELIRCPDVFDLIIKALFNPSKSVNPAHKNKYFYVLAYAASVKEIFDLDNPSQRIQDKSELEETIKALEVVHTICHKSTVVYELQDYLGSTLLSLWRFCIG